ncbi:MAG: cytochrome b/b6 domain-containing protein [Bacillota bacterium]
MGKKHEPRVICVLHWVHMAAFVIAALAGFYIHYPSRFFLFGAMTTAQAFKVVASDIFLLTFMIRLVHGLYTGDWRTLVFTPQDGPGLAAALKYRLLFAGPRPLQGRYDVFQKLLWTFWAFLTPALAITGVLMFSPTPGWLMAAVPPAARRLIKGFPGPTGYQVRTVHFLLASLLAFTFLIYLYSTLVFFLAGRQAGLAGRIRRQQPGE